MHRITLLTVGKIKTPWTLDGCAVYSERLTHSCDFTERILAADDPTQEQSKIEKAMEGFKGSVVVLDETGKNVSSVKFASWIGEKRDSGTPLLFVIGGAYGLNDRIRSKADLVLSLSAMTLAHGLCRLMFLEQLYRAHTILEGRGYHH